MAGGGLHVLAGALNAPLPAMWCFVFGALSSPTDPIAMGAILRSFGAPEALNATVTGESLSTGVGVVIFSVLL